MVKVSKPLSREYLVSRGYCCGSGCKNCPYDPPHEKGTKEIHFLGQNVNNFKGLYFS